MKILFLVLAIISFAALPVFSADEEAYTPYDPDEFPQWAHDVRRGEIIFFGSLPITAAVSAFLLPRIMPDISNSARITAAVSLSAAVAVTDFLLGRVFGE